MIRRAVLICLLAALALPWAALAHDLGVARAVLAETPGGRYLLEVETAPALAELFAAPVLPTRCVSSGVGTFGTAQTVLRYEFVCAEGPLTASDALRLPWRRQGAMLTARWADGSSARQFFARTGAIIVVPLAALRAGSGSIADAAGRYLGLGVEHILLGVDHLLFVFGLLLLVHGPWMLLKTITAFTLAHSITLALATLGLVAVPPRPVDAAIALSIVFLGAEILRARQGRPGLAASRPWVVAFAFGLLHGLGFAGALTELGLAGRNSAGAPVLQPRGRGRAADVRGRVPRARLGTAPAAGELAALGDTVARVRYWHDRRILVDRAHERVPHGDLRPLE